MIRSFTDIENRIEQLNIKTRKTIAIAGAQDERALKAAYESKKMRLADAILIGDENSIKKKAKESAIDISGFEIINRPGLVESAAAAVEQVKKGRAQMLMKGLIDTSVILRVVLDKSNGLRESKVLSYVTLFEVPGYERLFIITDPGLNIEPDLETKESIIKNAVKTAYGLGIKCPKVALICPVEKVNTKMQSTLDAKTIVEKYRYNESYVIGGPFALDNAVSEESAIIKGISDPVAGKADILALNDIGVGNVLYKSLTCFAKAKNAGIVVGAKVPILITSRADSMEAKLNSIKLGILMSEEISILKNVPPGLTIFTYEKLHTSFIVGMEFFTSVIFLLGCIISVTDKVF